MLHLDPDTPPELRAMAREAKGSTLRAFIKLAAFWIILASLWRILKNARDCCKLPTSHKSAFWVLGFWHC